MTETGDPHRGHHVTSRCYGSLGSAATPSPTRPRTKMFPSRLGNLFSAGVASMPVRLGLPRSSGIRRRPRVVYASCRTGCLGRFSSAFRETNSSSRLRTGLYIIGLGRKYCQQIEVYSEFLRTVRQLCQISVEILRKFAHRNYAVIIRVDARIMAR
jgi:hypothetical protein